MRLLRLPALCFCIVLVGCGAAQEYKSNAYGFTISDTQGWEMVEQESGALVSFLAPDVPDHEEAFQALVNVNVDVLAKEESAQEYVFALPDVLAENLPGFQLYEQSEETIAGQNAVRLFGFFTLGQQGIQLEQYYVPHGKEMVILTSMAEYDDFAQKRAAAKKIIHSLQFP